MNNSKKSNRHVIQLKIMNDFLANQAYTFLVFYFFVVLDAYFDFHIYFQKSLLITWNSTSKNFMVSHVAMVVAWMLLLRKRVKRAIFGDLLRLWGLWRVLGHHYVDGGTPSWCKYCVKSQTFWNPFKKLQTQDIFCSVFDFGPFFFKKKF